MKTHSWLSPSGLAPVVAGCVGKPFMERDIAETPPGPMTLRGTAIHEVAEAMLTLETVPYDEHPEDVILVAKNYYLYVMERANSYDTPVEMHIEKRVNVFPEIDISGTGDTFLWHPGTGTLELIDLKTGRIPVDVEENVQLLAYAWGFLRDHQHLTCLQVILHIFQPGNSQEPWAIPYHVLRTNIEKIQDAATLARLIYTEQQELDPDAHLCINDYCQYCRARGSCPKLRTHLREDALLLLEDNPRSLPKPSDLTYEQKLKVFGAKPIILSFLEALEADLYPLAAEGSSAELYLKPGKKVRSWNPEFPVGEVLRELGVEPFEKNLIGIGAAEKLLGKRKALIPQEAFTFRENAPRLTLKNNKEIDEKESSED